MRQQKNIFQNKEQDKIPEELSEVEISNLPNKEFKVIIIKMFKELRRRLDEQSEKLKVFNKELENIKRKQKEIKNIITEIKSTLEGINSRLDDTEEWINKLEERVVEITEAEQKKEKRNEDSLIDLKDNIKQANIHIIGVPEGKDGRKGLRIYLKK